MLVSVASCTYKNKETDLILYNDRVIIKGEFSILLENIKYVYVADIEHLKMVKFKLRYKT